MHTYHNHRFLPSVPARPFPPALPPFLALNTPPNYATGGSLDDGPNLADTGHDWEAEDRAYREEVRRQRERDREWEREREREG
jgi:hypothetical protein